MKKQYLSFVISTLIFLLIPLSPSFSQNIMATVSFFPNHTTVYFGEEQDIVVWVESVTDLYAFDLRIHFDPSKIMVLDSDQDIPGVQIIQGPFLDKGLIVVNRVDNEEGVISFAATQLNPSTPRCGSGVLILFRIRAINSGNTELVFQNIQLSGRDGFEIVSISERGTILIPLFSYWLPIIYSNTLVSAY